MGGNSAVPPPFYHNALPPCQVQDDTIGTWHPSKRHARFSETGPKRADETDVVIFVYGDNQFLLEIESLDLPLNLYFIHAGGYWFFRGLSGYVV
jgi:hypothetical protein